MFKYSKTGLQQLQAREKLRKVAGRSETLKTAFELLEKLPVWVQSLMEMEWENPTASSLLFKSKDIPDFSLYLESNVPLLCSEDGTKGQMDFVELDEIPMLLEKRFAAKAPKEGGTFDSTLKVLGG